VCVCCPQQPDVSVTDWTVAGIGWPLVNSFYILTLILTSANREWKKKTRERKNWIGWHEYVYIWSEVEWSHSKHDIF